MGTTARVLYLGTQTINQTPQPAYPTGSNVRGVQEAAPGATDATKANFGSGGLQELLFSPFTNTTTTNTTTTRDRIGWLLQAQDTVGTVASLDSTATAKRTVPAGQWEFSARVNATTAQVSQGSIIRFYVYRRSAGGIMTELFTVSSASTLLSTLDTDVSALTTQPQITLEADEALHYAVAVNTRGESIVLQTISLTVGAATFVNHPAPGVRTLFPRDGADTALSSDTTTRQVFRPRATADVALAVDTTARVLTNSRAIADVARAADTTTRVAAFPRAIADLARATDTTSRAVAFPRATTDTAPSSDTTTRATVLARIVADIARGSDTVSRVLTNVRTTVDVARAVDAVARVLTVARATADTARASDTLTRDVLLSRSTADLARGSDTVDRLITYVRSLREQIGPGSGDFVDVPSRVLAGVVRNNTGTPVVGATVLLMRVADDRAVQSTTSGAGGTYSFSRDKFDLNTYYVVSYLAGAPSTQGVTERGLVPVDA